MGLKKFILDIILNIFDFFFKVKKIDQNKVSFVSLESDTLKYDLLDIYNELKKDSSIKIKCVLINYNKKTLINNFKYMLNCIKQLYHINTSKIVLINDNNYVISNFKKEGVTVIQIWHACGAIKQFGNCIPREYPINNYDYVLSNSDYWKEPYSKAFNVTKENVISTGMPRVDHLYNQEYVKQTKEKLYKKYPNLQDKKIILYAPTFRGNIIKGFSLIEFDDQKLISSLTDEYVLIYKHHPLIKNYQITNDERIIDLSHEETHDLFTITDVLISDYSSIVFDYSVFNKPIISYIPDIDNYINDIGTFVPMELIPGDKCYNIDEVIKSINNVNNDGVKAFHDQFFKYNDGQNVKRVINLINSIKAN